MATEFFRKSFDFPAWSGSMTELQRLLNIVSASFEAVKDEAEEEIRRQGAADADAFPDQSEYRARVEERTEREVLKNSETFNLRANIDVGRSKRIVNGTPEEIADRLDERVRQDLRVQCPGGSTLHTTKEISLSLTSKYGVSLEVEGDDQNWVLGAYDRLVEEVKKQRPPDAWIVTWWAKGAASLGAVVLVASVGTLLPVPLWLNLTFSIGVGLWASMTVLNLLDKVNRFELLAPGKKARSTKAWAVIVELIVSVLAPVALYFLTR
jgi:hypothetical protein